jgi:hypothetical protein
MYIPVYCDIRLKQFQDSVCGISMLILCIANEQTKVYTRRHFLFECETELRTVEMPTPLRMQIRRFQPAAVVLTCMLPWILTC